MLKFCCYISHQHPNVAAFTKGLHDATLAEGLGPHEGKWEEGGT